ncbi:PREDICTED: CD63 antigen [Bactrocera latifrons]|uniref:Tetraspanin n=2 Tax=Bactrocera latifrons TaxID=174628 RepID=A0A0K8W976_BACLA|nr:PREDICTED: CD63 antigen [Bactrocera latifrons]XP_018802673.1 PREDICTED: CD63 antigen [Bactrocera latifrons]XP_018802674.1 PREDICTED: CD63 antigen [Bactrocera latifrons]XP_018802675.1 PREDICTED: CD63 antigen [Bactrocera latifrons]
MARDQLNSGMRCAKFMLVIVSFMFALTAVLLIMVGSTIQAIFGDFSQFIDGHFFSPPALLIAIGFILLLVATLGAYGAVKESVMLINLYGVSLFLVFILEVAAAIAAFVMQTQVHGMLMRTMNDSLIHYNENEYVQMGVDFMQETLGCCGVNSPLDWKPPNSTNAEIEVPASCCDETSIDDINYCIRSYDSGCLARMDFIISQSTMLIATGATTVAFVQLLGVLCAFMLAKTLRRNKSIREARRWQLQQSLGVLISGGKVVPPTISPINGYTQLERAERYMEHDPVTYTPSSPSVN